MLKTSRWTSTLRRAGAVALVLFATQAHAGPAVPPPWPLATQGSELATFSGGCFWSMNAIFERVKGVRHVTAGFSGGSAKSPSYERVSTGTTGHAETVQIDFDPAVISYSELLHIFFTFHDPTTLNRQGADVGTEYRSVIFTHSPQQQGSAKRAIADLTQQRVFRSPIVTQVQPFVAFYPAEDYHQDYYAKYSGQPYCRFVIAPKVAKLHKLFAGELKPSM